jgi:hypothetical protein
MARQQPKIVFSSWSQRQMTCGTTNRRERHRASSCATVSMPARLCSSLPSKQDALDLNNPGPSALPASIIPPPRQHHTMHHNPTHPSPHDTHITERQDSGAIPCRSPPPAVPAAGAAHRLRVRVVRPRTMATTATTTGTGAARRRAAAGKAERSSVWPDVSFRSRTGMWGVGVGWCVWVGGYVSAAADCRRKRRSWNRGPG